MGANSQRSLGTLTLGMVMVDAQVPWVRSPCLLDFQNVLEARGIRSWSQSRQGAKLGIAAPSQ